jgi:cell division septal protein FtsQ
VSVRTGPPRKPPPRNPASRKQAPRREGSARPARAPVDPRVRERWIEARRAEGRRRLRWVVALLVVVGILAAAWGVTMSPLLDVDRIEVTGAVHASTAQVESAAGIHDGDPLVWLDAAGAVDGVQSLPYVRTAKVERSWPDAVRIVVVERVPAAWVEHGGRRGIVDGTGRVLALVDAPPAGLPQLAGDRPVPEPGATIVSGAREARVAAALVGLSVPVQSIVATEAGVSLQLVHGPEVRLGEGNRVVVKVRAALAVIAATFAAGTTVHYVDVSAPTNPVAG